MATKKYVVRDEGDGTFRVMGYSALNGIPIGGFFIVEGEEYEFALYDGNEITEDTTKKDAKAAELLAKADKKDKADAAKLKFKSIDWTKLTTIAKLRDVVKDLYDVVHNLED